MLELHAGDSSESGECECCGHVTRTVWGYVYRDGKALCAYYTCWTVGHLDRGLKFLLNIGDWGEGTNAGMRRSVGLECQLVNNVPSCMVIDATETAWCDSERLGMPLSREQVMGDPIKQEAFDIFDCVLQDDPRVREFVYGVPSGN